MRIRLAGLFPSFEFAFVLYLNAGRLKALALSLGIGLPIDLTIALLAFVVLSGGLVLVRQLMRGELWTLDGQRLGVQVTTGFFFAVGCLAYFWGPENERGLYLLATYAVILPASYLGASAIIAPDAQRVRRFFAWLVSLAFAIAVASVYAFLRGKGVKYVGGSSYLTFARVLGMAVLIPLGYMLRPQAGWMSRTWHLTIALAFLVPMYLLGGRAPLLGVGLALGVGALGAVQLRGYQRVRLRPALLTLGVVLGLAVAAFVVLMLLDADVSAVRRINRLFDPSFRDESALMREYLWTTAIDISRDGSVWRTLFGYGLGGFQSQASTSEGLAYPHSLPLELLVEVGAIGLLLFVGAFLLHYRHFRLRRDAIAPELHDVLRMLTAYWFFNQMVGGAMENSAWPFAIMGLLVLRRHERNAMTV